MICIIDCDLDKSTETNGAGLIAKYLKNCATRDITVHEDIDISLYSGFVISGSRASIYSDYEWVPYLFRVLKEIYDSAKPCLGVCFGMQAMAGFLGGRVANLSEKKEGFKRIGLSSHWLFEGCGDVVYLSHGEYVENLPGVNVIGRDECIQGFEYQNFFGVQFHPEITPGVAKKMALRDGKDFRRFEGDVAYYQKPFLVLKNFENYN